jgi:hypothetical protein
MMAPRLGNCWKEGRYAPASAQRPGCKSLRPELGRELGRKLWMLLEYLVAKLAVVIGWTDVQDSEAIALVRITNSEFPKGFMPPSTCAKLAAFEFGSGL